MTPQKEAKVKETFSPPPCDAKSEAFSDGAGPPPLTLNKLGTVEGLGVNTPLVVFIPVFTKRESKGGGKDV